jgi:hypothetical protein
MGQSFQLRIEEDYGTVEAKAEITNMIPPGKNATTMISSSHSIGEHNKQKNGSNNQHGLVE